MTDTNDVYRKIKEMSSRTANPRPPILIAAIAQELLSAKEQILPGLTELKDLHLIRFEGVASAYVKLTLLGNTVKR